MANAKHEDAVMKMGFDYFRNTILKTLGIDRTNRAGGTDYSVFVYGLYLSDYGWVLYTYRVSDYG